jgi:hypothetical protein
MIRYTLWFVLIYMELQTIRSMKKKNYLWIVVLLKIYSDVISRVL